MSRAPHVTLGSWTPRAVGWIEGQAGSGWQEPAVLKLTELGAELLREARFLTKESLPTLRRHALIGFRTALDAVAGAVVGHFGHGFGGRVQPPCNYPMALQQAILQFAGTVEVVQEWDARQPGDRAPDTLPAETVANLEEAIALLQPDPKAAGVIYFHGAQSYALGAGSHGAVGNELHDALQAFLRAGTALTTKQLEDAGFKNVARVMKSLDEMFPGCVHKPRRKGAGYYVIVKRA